MMGLFEYADDTVDAIHELKNAGFDDLVVFSPIPVHEIEHALEHDQKKFIWSVKSIIEVVRNRNFHVLRFTLIGMVGGVSAALLLTFGTALNWPIPQGGMPIIALPPIGLITYELGSLGAALGTIGGFMYLSWLPTMKDEVYDEAVGSDRFGIAVKEVDPGTIEVVRNIMTECHAVSIEEKTGALR